MLDIGWSELLLIGIVALIVVGPRDLPIMFRTLGRFVAKARSMAREFQRAMDDAVKSSGVADAVKDVKDMTSKKSLGIDALESAVSKFEKWNPTMPGAKPAGGSPTPKLASGLTDPPVISMPEAGGAAEPAIMGPATRALAEEHARKRAERLADKTGPAAPAVAAAAASKPGPAAKPRRTRPAAPAAALDAAAPVPAAKPARARKAAASVAAPAVAAPAAVKPAPAAKPRTKKSDA